MDRNTKKAYTICTKKDDFFYLTLGLNNVNITVKQKLAGYRSGKSWKLKLCVIMRDFEICFQLGILSVIPSLKLREVKKLGGCSNACVLCRS